MNEIETKFYEALIQVLKRGFVIYLDQKIDIKQEDDWYSIKINKDRFELLVEPQPKEDYFSGYIPDFVIYINGQAKGYVIEIDGHEWHEKTKEQVKADKEKDRTYLRNCFIPIRFTGSEVYHNAKRCADEVFDILITNYEMFDYENKNIENYLLQKKAEKLYQVVNGFGSEFAFVIGNNSYQLRPNVIEMNSQRGRK